MTGDDVAVVEMTMLAGFELDVAVVVEAGGKAAVGMNCLNDGEVAISNASDLSGAVNWIRSPTENSRSFSR